MLLTGATKVVHIEVTKFDFDCQSNPVHLVVDQSVVDQLPSLPLALNYEDEAVTVELPNFTVHKTGTEENLAGVCGVILYTLFVEKNSEPEEIVAGDNSFITYSDVDGKQKVVIKLPDND